MLRILISIGLCLILIFVSTGKVSALDLGVLDLKHVTNKGFFVGGSFAKNYDEPLASLRWNNWELRGGWTLNIYDQVDVDFVPVSVQVGSPTEFSYGLTLKYYFKK